MKVYSSFSKLRERSYTTRFSLMSYPERSLKRRSYPSAEIQSVYSTASADRMLIYLKNIYNIMRVLQQNVTYGSVAFLIVLLERERERERD